MIDEPSRKHQESWQVWRQDDHGNKFLVKGDFRCRGDAQKLCDELTARGHKQTYWVEKPDIDPSG